MRGYEQIKTFLPKLITAIDGAKPIELQVLWREVGPDLNPFFLLKTLIVARLRPQQMTREQQIFIVSRSQSLYGSTITSSSQSSESKDEISLIEGFIIPPQQNSCFLLTGISRTQCTFLFLP